MNLPPYIQVRDGSVWLSVKAQPRASRNEISGPVGSELKVKVTAPPVDSAANQALTEFIAELLDCPRRSVAVVRGDTARHKVVRIDGVPVEKVVNALSQTST
jgi:uncharacterized protein